MVQLYGSIEDLVPYRTALGTISAFLSLEEWLWKAYCSQAHTVIVFYSATSGFYNHFSEENVERFDNISGNSNEEGFLGAAQKIVQALKSTTEDRIVVIIDSTIRCLTSGPIIQPNDQRAFTILKNAVVSSDMTGQHQLVFVNEQKSDIPPFLLASQSHSKSIIIPKPDQIQRCGYLSYLFSNRHFSDSDLFSVAQRAESLTLIEIRNALSHANYASCTINDLMNQICLFQFGFSEDPWRQINPSKIDNAEQILGNYVFGQDEAIKYSAEVIKYAASGFGGVFQEDGRTAPKGVLFFCGLSGTGKTELAKAIARLVFGSADSMIRFDMGEYNQPHSAERLTGAPPGYIGHDAGGQLTEAIKAHPFCLLLFDEIEKADAAVMNKFLSVLEDGRLTDGKGETVSFENTIVVFTSNLGAADAVRESNPAKVREIISNAVKQYCEEQPPYGIGKPELYSRLAGNIVIFNPLSEEAIQRIFDNYYQQAIGKISSQLEIQVSCTDDFENKLRALIDDERNRGKFPGGRGMKKAMDKYFLVPLAGFSYRERCKKGDTIELSDFNLHGDVVEMIGTVSHTRMTNQNRPQGDNQLTTTNTQTGFRVEQSHVSMGDNKTTGFTVINKRTP